MCIAMLCILALFLTNVEYVFILALFLIRDDEFTEALPPGEIKDAFVDDNDLCSEKLKKLKEMLQEHFPVCIYFTAVLCIRFSVM